MIQHNALNYFNYFILILLNIPFLFISCNSITNHQKKEYPDNKIYVFCGAASKPPMEEIVDLFKKKKEIDIEITYGGSGFVLSQMQLTEKGDIYMPGSSDFMEKAKKSGLVLPETEKKIVYLIPEINVQKGNPKKIKSLKDLTRPNIRIAIGQPENVCVGTYAVEIIENTFTPSEKKQFKKNIINYTESCEKTANVLSLKLVDAVMAWDIFQYWDTTHIERIKLNKHEIVRVGYVPVAISKFTQNKQLAQQFIDFLISKESKNIFKKYHYLTNIEEVYNYTDINGNSIGKKTIGGIYQLPAKWVFQSNEK